MKTVVCEWCGNTLPEDEAENPRDKDGEIICDECWSEHFAFRCVVCDNSDDKDFQETHVVVVNAREAFAEKGARRGIYQVLSCPYFAAPMIGEGHLWASSLKRVANVPKNIPEGYDYACGHLCHGCLIEHAPKLATLLGVV